MQDLIQKLMKAQKRADNAEIEALRFKAMLIQEMFDQGELLIFNADTGQTWEEPCDQVNVNLNGFMIQVSLKKGGK